LQIKLASTVMAPAWDRIPGSAATDTLKN
jgi:hypothetical protein